MNKKGFTLAELLIVVAIIAVLVAIAIPIFVSQLEKSREATDAANIRDYYAEISVGLLDGSLNSTNKTMTVSGNKTATANYDSNGKLTTVEVAGVSFKQTVSADWAIGAPEVAGVKVTAVPTTANTKITYTFAEDASGHTYLSEIAFGA